MTNTRYLAVVADNADVAAVKWEFTNRHQCQKL